MECGYLQYTDMEPETGESETLDEFDQFLAQSRGRLNTLGCSPCKSPRHSKRNSQFSLPSPDKGQFRETCLGASATTPVGHRKPASPNDALSSAFVSLHGLGDDWDLGESRPRARTMPSGGASPRLRPPRLVELRRGGEDIHRVRAFQLTEKGLVKGGERYVSSTGTSKAGSAESVTPETGPFKILLLGASGVGKRALIRELIDPSTSNHHFNSLDDDTERCVSILLDGEESNMEFVDISDKELDQFIAANDIDAFVVVYSVEDRDSFQTAVDRLYEIRQDVGRHVALILVANKTDLVRTRIIHAEEGKAAAKTYDCKYIEVSAAIDHKIDELLVGILKQIRLIRSKLEKARQKSGSRYRMDETCCLLQARQNVLARIFKGEGNTTKSCDNLYVL